MKSRSRNQFPKPEIPLVNGHGEPPLTFDRIIEKWAGVFEPEFWDEVRKARGCNCHHIRLLRDEDELARSSRPR